MYEVYMGRKPGPQRTRMIKANHMYQEAQMYLQGYSQAQIAKTLNVAVMTVNKDLAEVRERWVQSAIIDFTERTGAELEKIDKLEMEYIEGYERSKKSRITVIKKRLPIYREKESGRLYVSKEGGLIDSAGEPVEIAGKKKERVDEIIIEESIKTENRDGDPTWLNGIAHCIDMRLKLFGLYRTISVPGPEGSSEQTEESTKVKMALLLAIVDQWQKQITAGRS
jgi:hypothetical protein